MSLSKRHNSARAKVSRMTAHQLEQACKSRDFVLAAEAQKLRNSRITPIFNRKT